MYHRYGATCLVVRCRRLTCAPEGNPVERQVSRT